MEQDNERWYSSVAGGAAISDTECPPSTEQLSWIDGFRGIGLAPELGSELVRNLTDSPPMDVKRIHQNVVRNREQLDEMAT